MRIRFTQFKSKTHWIGMLLIMLVGLVSCGERVDQVDLNKSSRLFELPLYYTVSGEFAGEGKIFKVNKLKPGAAVEPEIVAQGLNFPTGLAVDYFGNIFYTEKLPKPDGTLKVIKSGTTTSETLADGLDNPEGLSIDTWGRVFVTQNSSDGLGKVLMYWRDELTHITPQNIDTNQLGYVLFSSVNGKDELVVSRVSVLKNDDSGQNSMGEVALLGRDNNLESLKTGLQNPYGVAFSKFNEVFYIDNKTGRDDGQLVRIKSDKTVKVIAESLINPIDVMLDAENDAYVIESYPANRILRINTKTGLKTKIVETSFNPHSLALTPLSYGD